jgi:hypothetical protein
MTAQSERSQGRFRQNGYGRWAKSRPRRPFSRASYLPSPLCPCCCATALPAGCAHGIRRRPVASLRGHALAGAEECPDAPGLTSAVAKALAADPPETPPERIRAAAFDVEFSRDGARYVAKLHDAALGVDRTIESDGPGCASLAGAVGVAVTFVLDSMNRADAGPTEATPTPAPTPTPTPTPTRDRTDIPRRPRTAPAENSAFIELLGSAIAYSLNYEHLFTRYVGARVGFGMTYDSGPGPGGRTSSMQVLFPLLATIAIPVEGAEFIHLGAGATIDYRTSVAPDGWYYPVNGLYGGRVQNAGVNVLANTALGYRHLPRGKGDFIFGFDLVLLFTLYGAVPWAGASTGITF